MTTPEGKYKKRLKSVLRQLYPGCGIIDVDPYVNDNSMPDMIVVYGPAWVMLETKKEVNAEQQPNQGYYIRHFDKMSYASFASPENHKEVLRDVEIIFGPHRPEG